MSINWERGNILPWAIHYDEAEFSARSKLPWDAYQDLNTTNYKSAHSFEMDYDGSNYTTPSGSNGMYWENNNQGFISGIAAGTYTTSGHTTSSLGTTSAQVGNTYWRRYLLAWTLSQAEIFGGGLSGYTAGIGGTISALSFYISNPPGSAYQPQTTEIGLVNLAAGTTGSTNPAANASLVRVFDASVNLSSASGLTAYNFNITNFTYTGGALGITFALSQCPTNYTSDGQSYYMNGGTTFYARTDGAGAYTYNGSTTNTNTNQRPATWLTFV